MVAGLLGNAETEPYIKLRHRGTDYFFPLSHDPEERYLGGGDIQTSTLESFSPSSVAGDPSLVSNELLAVMLWSNFQGGMGTVKYQEQEGTGSLDSFAYSTLDTRFQGMALLPPRRISLGTLPTVLSRNVDFLLTSVAGVSTLVVWNIAATFPATIGVGKPTGVGGATVWTSFTFPIGTNDIRAIVPYNGFYVAATDAGTYTSLDLVTWTLRWSSAPNGFIGLCVHDNKLYTWNNGDGKLYWTTDPTTLVAWPNSSTDRLAYVNTTEVVIKIVEWKNRQDTRSLFILTSQRILAWDDDGYWVEFFGKDQIAGTSADLAVWPQDKALYFSPYDNGANVMQFQNQTISNISPNKKGGLSATLARVIVRLRGTLNFLYAQGSGALNSGIYGTPATTTTTGYGAAMVYNGQGWHTLAEGTSTDPLTSLGIAKDQVFFVRNNRFVETIYTPDAPQSPLYINGPVTYAEGTFYIESADADAGLENIYKTARYFELVIENNNGGPSEPGIPTGHTYTFEYVPDGAGNWYTLASNQGPGQGRIIRIPVTTSVYADARGLPFIKIRWRLTFTKSGGADATVTPILRSVALYYLRANDLIDGIQFAIDLSPERVKKMMTSLGLGHTYNGKTPQKLRALLQDIKRSKYNPAITYGPPNNRVTIPAAEIRIAQRENPRTALGQYIVTARDVSTQTTTQS